MLRLITMVNKTSREGETFYFYDSCLLKLDMIFIMRFYGDIISIF